MKELFLSLLFAKMVLLAPSPMDIGSDWIEIKLEKPISAITQGSAVNIELASSRSFSNEVKDQKNISEFLGKLYPDGTIDAVLTTKDNQSFWLTNTGFLTSGYGESENIRVEIKLTGQPQIPTDKKFTSLKIRSQRKLGQVKIYWKNFSK